MFCCLLFTVLFAIVSIVSSTILKLYVGLVLFLDKICSHEYPFFHFYCAGKLKHTIENKGQCNQQINKYTEQGE